MTCWHHDLRFTEWPKGEGSADKTALVDGNRQDQLHRVFNSIMRPKHQTLTRGERGSEDTVEDTTQSNNYNEGFLGLTRMLWYQNWLGKARKDVR